MATVRTSPDQEPACTNDQLIFAGRDCYVIPTELHHYGGKVRTLDLSFNSINDLEGLELFSSKLEELVLDNNEIDDSSHFPLLPHVTLLSLCNNKITDLYKFIDEIDGRLPKLTYLSLIGNKACPDAITQADCDESDYHRYRKYVIYKFPRLKFLDSKPVTRQEKLEAKRQGPFLRVVRPTSESNLDNASVALPYNPLPSESGHRTASGIYRKAKYVYHGKHSEGNRFIRNGDL